MNFIDILIQAFIFPALLSSPDTSDLPLVDIILGILLIIGLIRGLRKGFIVEIASLIALILGIYGAIHFSYYAVDFLNNYFSWEDRYINLAALLLTFVLIVIFISLLAKLFTKLAKLIALNMLNRLLGGIFGVLKVAFILSVLLMFFKNFNQEGKILPASSLEKSILYSPIEKFGAELSPSVLNEIKNHASWFDEEKS